jgi:hypothetical protein
MPNSRQARSLTLGRGASKTASSRRRELADAISGVEGWLGIDEAWALYEITTSLISSEALTVVEIGSWKGRSTIALALGIRARGSGKVYAIDPHTGGREIVDLLGPVNSYSEFISNLNSAGVRDLVVPLVTTSHEARMTFPDHGVNLLFVDGSHEYQYVLEDVQDWRAALKDGAMVAFNDPYHPGVNRALREAVLVRNGPFRKPKHLTNTIIFEFTRARAWSVKDTLALLKIQSLMALRQQAKSLRSYMPRWAQRFAVLVYDRLASM